MFQALKGRKKEVYYTLVFYVGSSPVRSLKVPRVESIKRKCLQISRRFNWKYVKVFNRYNGNYITQFKPGDNIPDFVRGFYFND